MSGLFGAGGKTDRGQQLRAWGQLSDIFYTGKEQAGQLGTAAAREKATGFSDIASAEKYWKSLLSGNRQALTSAAAPAANAARAQSDASKRQEASMGTSRTGGTAAANREADTNVQGQMDALIGAQKAEAPGQLASLGSTMAGFGEQDIANMLSALGISSGAAGTVGAQSTADIASLRQQETDIQKFTVDQINNLVKNLLTHGMGSMGGGGGG